MTKEYDTLILSGGGLKGFSSLGALQLLHDNDKLNKIRTYIGCSIGAVISVLLILKYEPNEILTEFISNQSLSDANINIIQGLSGKGFIDFDELTSIFSKMVKKKTGRIISLSELEEIYDSKLICICYNFTDRCECIITKESFPDISVLEVIRMTSSVPFIFDAFEYKNKLYLDGFLISNFPLHLLEETNKAIGVNIINVQDETKPENSSFSKWDYFWNVIMIPLTELQKLKTKEYRGNCDIISIQVNNYFSIDKFKGYSTLVNLYTHGYNVATKQLNDMTTIIEKETVNES